MVLSNFRVKEAKRHRWGKLVDQNGDNKNPNHSGGEKIPAGAARSIETMRRKGKGQEWKKRNRGDRAREKKSTPKTKKARLSFYYFDIPTLSCIHHTNALYHLVCGNDIYIYR
jgi:hypothetical protein